MFQYHCLNPISGKGLDMFTTDYKQVDDLAEADAVLVRSAAMHDLKLPERLAAVARAGAGVNNIPLDKCAEQGIVVFNTPGANANGVKELVLASLILASRDVIGGIQWCQSIKDDPNIAKAVEKGKKAFAGCEIRGKKLGVIGLGAIGVEVANAAAALGMTVYGYDPFISVNGAWMLSRDVKHIMTADDIYKECDYITLHVPLLDSTRGMISASVLQEMKDGVVVLNFSRDVLVDEDAMAEALNSGKVKKYITDFPNPKSANMAGAVVIPHLGASTEESEDNCAKMAVKEIMDYLENGNIRNSVNYPNCDMGVCRAVCRLTVLHRNIPNMIGQITAVLAAEGINISDMTNKSKDKFAYTMVDLEQKAAEEALERIRSIDGVLRVRAL